MKKGKLFLKRKDEFFEAGYCIAKGTKDDIPKMINTLHANEEAYYYSLKHERRKASYLIGRFAAKEAVLELTGKDAKQIHVSNGIFNFPVVKGVQPDNIQITLTHCNDIAVAIAFPEEHPLGVDLEKIDAERHTVIKEIVNAGEMAQALKEGVKKEEVFIFFWTVKEALSKILRTGFACNTEIFQIKEFYRTCNSFESRFLNFIQYKGYTIQSAGYVCSIVLPDKTSVELEDFNRSFIHVSEDK
jgi:4'-phosphopantetheinyl transferase